MPELIKDGTVSVDSWTLVRDAEATLPSSPVIVPLATWLTKREELRKRTDVGVWLAPADDPSLLAGDAATLPIIAVDFPKFADGRGYSIGRLLRDRFFFKGELRAVGDVARDQLYYLHQVGFNTFLLRDGKDARDALASLRDFSDGYQVTHRRTPWFRRSGTAAPTTIEGTKA
ncbi:MAG TPA: DUF934 domain-containing protein [Casimicrobiaceae bacterium]|nr:DUF934 domain-containing protein [Casimicrobiaceae bacterium]